VAFTRKLKTNWKLQSYIRLW